MLTLAMSRVRIRWMYRSRGRELPGGIGPSDAEVRCQMCGHFDVIDRQFEIPLEINGRMGHFAHEDVGPDAADVVDHLGLQQQIASGQQIVGDVVLRTANGHAVTHAQRTEHVQHFGVPSVLLQQRYDHFDVLLLLIATAENRVISPICVSVQHLSTIDCYDQGKSKIF